MCREFEKYEVLIFLGSELYENYKHKSLEDEHYETLKFEPHNLHVEQFCKQPTR
jgi:hypothetical protein